MRHRGTLLLLLLAVGVVCILLWQTVIGPALEEGSDDSSVSMLEGEDFLEAGPGDDGSGPSLSPMGRAPRPGEGVDGRGPFATGPDGRPLGAARGSSAHVPFEGRVKAPDGGPATKVTITLKGAQGLHVVETDANGAFKQDVPPGRYALLFEGEEGGLLVRSYMIDGAPKEDLEFALREPGAIEVKVQRGKDGVSGVPVLAISRDLGDLAKLEGVTDLDGLAKLEGLVPGRYDVTATVPEGPLVKHGTYASPGGTRKVYVRIPEGVVLKGIVRAGKGGPGVGGAEITLHSQPSKTHGIFETVFETKPDGTYEVVVPRGRPRVFNVVADGRAPWPSEAQRRGVLRSLRGLYGKKPVTRNVTLQDGAVLGGLVQTEEKQPIPGITLRFKMRRTVVASSTTKGDGRYSVAHLNPGRYDVQVETPAYFPIQGQVMRVSIPGGATPQPQALDITLVGARRLEGVILDAAGQGVAGARVWIIGGGRVVRSARDAGRLLEVFTNAKGGWTITDIPPDKNVVVRAAMGLLEADPVYARWDKPPPQPIRMTLKGTGTLRGTVVDIGTRTNIAGARVRIVPDPYNGRTGRTVVTNNKGEFLVQRLIPGGWKATPSKNGYLVAGPESVNVSRDGESTATLRLDPGQVWAGIVVDEAGRPLRYVRIRVDGLPEGSEKRMSRGATTDARGRFRLTGFPHGVWRVRIYRKGYRTVQQTDVRGGDDRMHVVLRRR